MKLIGIGFGNLVAAGRILAVVSPESAPIKRMIQDLREKGLLIDASFGRSTKSVLIMDSGNVILSALTPETLAQMTGRVAVPLSVEKPGLQGIIPSCDAFHRGVERFHVDGYITMLGFHERLPPARQRVYSFSVSKAS